MDSNDQTRGPADAKDVFAELSDGPTPYERKQEVLRRQREAREQAIRALLRRAAIVLAINVGAAAGLVVVGLIEGRKPDEIIHEARTILIFGPLFGVAAMAFVFKRLMYTEMRRQFISNREDSVLPDRPWLLFRFFVFAGPVIAACLLPWDRMTTVLVGAIGTALLLWIANRAIRGGELFH